MPLAQTKFYTEDDYYTLPENVRAELIDGYLVYNQAAPSRIHQTILMELSGNYSGIYQIKKRILPGISCPICRQTNGRQGNHCGTGYQRNL